jgi:translocator protein
MSWHLYQFPETGRLDPLIAPLHIAAMNLTFPVRLALAILPVAIASILGGLVTSPAIPNWYAALAKPSFNPPSWVFGPVWTLLYMMMAYAAFRILSLPPSTHGRRLALSAFFLQLALNAAWSPAFFGMRSTLLGLVATVIAFLRVDKISAFLLLPYLAWVSFATILNFELFRLNG